MFFSSTKLENKRAEQFLPGSAGGTQGREVAKIVYTHVSKCKYDKINFLKNLIFLSLDP
jgi:hypothetical protein